MIAGYSQRGTISLITWTLRILHPYKGQWALHCALLLENHHPCLRALGIELHSLPWRSNPNRSHILRLTLPCGYFRIHLPFRMSLHAHFLIHSNGDWPRNQINRLHSVQFQLCDPLHISIPHFMSLKAHFRNLSFRFGWLYHHIQASFIISQYFTGSPVFHYCHKTNKLQWNNKIFKL